MISLRARLILVFAALAAAVSIAATAIAYAATDHQLSTQLDGSVKAAAAEIAASPSSSHFPGSTLPQGPTGGTASGALPPGSIPSGPGQSPGRPQGAFGLVIAQELRANGTVVARFSAVSLPVTARDKAIAESDAPAWLRTQQVDDVPYRVITVGLGDGGAVQVAQSLAPIDGVLGALRWRLGGLDAFLIVLAGLVGLLVARRITTPLELLTATAEEVSVSGSFDRPVSTTGRDEVGRLGRSFAAMLAALQTSKAQQQQLVRDAGHELRTPLTSIRSNVDLLRRHRAAFSDEAVAHVLEEVDLELRELSGLMDEVVELATDQRASEAVVEVRVDEVVERAVTRARSRSGREITVTTEPWSAAVRPRSLERAIANLLDNAVKFSPDSTAIEVEVGPGSISVRDHGPGFDEMDLGQVFERFYRSEAARSLPGSGLGLAIVRQIVEDSGGTVRATNREAAGAELRIEIPISPGQAPLGETDARS